VPQELADRDAQILVALERQVRALAQERAEPSG
jgi:hypothetical protein